jgi:hypothetical protein
MKIHNFLVFKVLTMDFAVKFSTQIKGQQQQYGGMLIIFDTLENTGRTFNDITAILEPPSMILWNIGSPGANVGQVKRAIFDMV